MSNVQRSSRSGLKCQCVGSDIDSTDVRIPSPVRLNDLGRWIGTLVGGADFIHGATGIIWLTGVSISLNAVSGLSAMGTTEMKMTAVIRRSRNIHSVRFTTTHPIAWNLTASAVRCQPLPDICGQLCRTAAQPMGGCPQGRVQTIGVRLSSATRTTPLRSSAINIRSETFLQPPFGSRSRISGACRSSNSSSVKRSSIGSSPSSGSAMTSSGPRFPRRTLTLVTGNPLTRRTTGLADSILQQIYWPALPNQVMPVQKQA
jgi:hypothetical protein